MNPTSFGRTPSAEAPPFGWLGPDEPRPLESEQPGIVNDVGLLCGLLSLRQRAYSGDCELAGSACPLALSAAVSMLLNAASAC